MLSRPFAPHFGVNRTGTLAAAGTASFSIPSQDESVRVTNSGSGDLYIRTSNSVNGAAPASNNCMRVLPGSSIVFFTDNTQDTCSLYSLAGTTYDVITGNGGV